MSALEKGGTPCRARAARRRQRLFQLVRASGAVKRSRIAEYFPEVTKHAMDKHIQHLRSAGLIEMQKHGVWRAVERKG